MEISIGTLSKAFDLSDEALRFYEKRGLLHPKRHAGNKYRVFDQIDIQRVANIQRLKSQGFTLDEIQHTYTCCTEEELQAVYTEHIKQMEQEIAVRQCMLAIMQRAVSTLSDANATEPPDMPTRATVSDVYLLEYPSIAAMWENLPGNPLLGQLFHQLPLVTYTTLYAAADFASPQGRPLKTRKGVLFPSNHLSLLDVPTQSLRHISGGDALILLVRLQDGCYDPHAALARLREAMQAENLRPADDLYTDQLLSYVDPSGHVIQYSRIVARVEPQK